MREREFYLVIDTETCNTIEQPFCYDIGYAIADRFGNIYERRSYVVAEIFLDMKDVMQSAYYAEKIPQYWAEIQSGERELKTLSYIRKQIFADIKEYKIKKVFAYNMGFDKRALNNTIRYKSQSFFRWFFPFGIEFNCIWSMACQTILNTKSYIDFAEENGFVSESDNIKTDAENCYRFLTKNIDFAEKHTGLADVEIEVQIMAKCFATHKKMDKSINASCWRIPQEKRKEIAERG